MASDGCTGFQWIEWLFKGVRDCCVFHDAGGSDGVLLDCIQASTPSLVWPLVGAFVTLMILFRPLYVIFQKFLPPQEKTMNIITLDQLSLMAGTAPNDNMRSVEMVINQYGRRFGLDRLHRLAQFLAQLLHESGAFKYDRELWGPTPAQLRYDTRTDLGNTPALDGDGERNKGRGPIQVTGGDNYRAFTRWARLNIDPNAPDFFAQPDLLNTDPWEGLSAVWYWATRGLNALADTNNIEQITKKINGGRNGLADRIDKYERVALVLAGFGPTSVQAFQAKAQARGYLPADKPGEPTQVDGDPGPLTRSALHMWLSSVDSSGATVPAPETVKAAPVVEEVETQVAVVPKGSEKSGSSWWVGLTGLAGTVGTAFMDSDFTTKLLLLGIVVLAFAFFLWRGQSIANRVKAIVKDIEA